jgi:hypothetical protein
MKASPTTMRSAAATRTLCQSRCGVSHCQDGHGRECELTEFSSGHDGSPSFL